MGQPGAAAWRRGCCGTAVGGAGGGRSLAAGAGAHARVEACVGGSSCWLTRTGTALSGSWGACGLGPRATDGAPNWARAAAVACGNAGWVWKGGGGGRQRQGGWVRRARGGGSSSAQAATVRATEGEGAGGGGRAGGEGPAAWPLYGCWLSNSEHPGCREGGRAAGWQAGGSARGATLEGAPSQVLPGVAVGCGLWGSEGCWAAGDPGGLTGGGARLPGCTTVARSGCSCRGQGVGALRARSGRHGARHNRWSHFGTHSRRVSHGHKRHGELGGGVLRPLAALEASTAPLCLAKHPATHLPSASSRPRLPLPCHSLSPCPRALGAA